MNQGPSIDARWYAPLVRPVLPTVRSALDEVDAPDDPWTVPRTGLGGAVVIHVAKEFGMRRWRRAGKVAVVALEGYNQRVHREDPTEAERANWLARDFGWVRRVWTSVLEHDGLVLGRVMDRLLGDEHGIADSPVPEAVLFLRSAVAAGVVAGAVPDGVHAALDRHATWLGLAWEANRGTLCQEGWHGALRGVDGDEPFPDNPDGHARLRAREALDGLPESRIVPILAELLAHAPHEPARERNPRAWSPTLAPAPVERPRRGLGGDGDLATFGAAWCERIDRALAAVVTSKSTALHSATRFLVGQGGKRVRPLITLAAARACGGDPQSALRLAAGIEWIHQGSLVLDDIVDQAPLRRGAPPLHEATSTPFAAGVAVFVLARVLRSIDGVDPAVRRRLVDAGSTLVVGEQLELRHTHDRDLSLTGYYRVIEAKTARLFSAAAAVGGEAIGAPRRQVKALSRFGREIGLAFQITDDLLDYVGDERQLGKRPGTDLRAGKMTLPLILLRDELGADWIGDVLGDGEALDRVLAAMREHAVEERCRERADEHRRAATEALAALPDDDGRALLSALGQRLAERQR